MCDTFCRADAPHGKPSRASGAVAWRKRKSLSSDWGVSQRSKGEVQNIEVIGEGTKFMRSLKLPTVIVRVSKGDLAKSTVYYVLLESHSEGLPTRTIPAIMLSDPKSRWRTQFAELFPLSVDVNGKGEHCITPLQYRTHCKQLFQKGCTFKVLALESGRYAESSESLPWNRWKLNLPALRNMITQILYQDIKQMPTSILQRATHSRSRTNSVSSNSTSVVLNENYISQESSKRVLSQHYPNLRLPGVAASGVSSFATWFKAVPPNIKVDENFKCEHGTTLRKDRFVDADTYYRYLRISE